MPIDDDRFFSLLGLAMRAGQLSLGEGGALKALACGKAAFLLVDAGASENTKKEFRDGCQYRGVPYYETAAGRLGRAVGRPGRMSAAAVPGPLAKRLADMIGAGAEPRALRQDGHDESDRINQ